MAEGGREAGSGRDAGRAARLRRSGRSGAGGRAGAAGASGGRGAAGGFSPGRAPRAGPRGRRRAGGWGGEEGGAVPRTARGRHLPRAFRQPGGGRPPWSEAGTGPGRAPRVPPARTGAGVHLSPPPRPGLRPRAASRGCEGIGRRRAGGAAIGGGAAPQPAGGTPGDSSTAGPGPGLRGHVGEEAYAWK